MNFKRLQIPDVIIIEPQVYNDSRGYFTELYRKDKLNVFLGFTIDFCQVNESKSSRGIVRGLHYQTSPYAQTKLVRVVSGHILDVVVDLRKDSKTFGQHLSVELSSDNKKLLLVPKGFAHGFIVLSKHASVIYESDNYYQPEYERGILFNDKFLGIDWRLKTDEIKLSYKDAELALFKDAEFFESSIDLYE